ncbi:hypothetical protein, partial [Pelomicrobium sp. G1]|uniref:hypothetical protein n=1 Tax=Pelomicrobium sp. G1 TaxID=3452920 RepID=UPI003F77023E
MAYNNLYKPTQVYPFDQFWGAVNEAIFDWLYEQKRITRPLKAHDFAASVDKRFMDATFKKLGWAIPQQPPFLPKGWRGDPRKVPYPEYIHAFNTKEPQSFPEPGD